MATVWGKNSPVNVTASCDSTVLTMGSQAMVNVEVKLPSSMASSAEFVNFPILQSNQDYMEFNGVEVVESDSIAAENGSDTNINFRFKIQAFDPGMVIIPPFAVVPSPGADTVKSSIITLKVLPVEVDSLTQLCPMESIVAPNSKWHDYIPGWLAWVFGILAVLAAGIWAYLRFGTKERRQERHQEVVIPPYDLALQRLSALRNRGLGVEGREKEYYTELVDILRQYLDGRFGINAMEMTSTQIMKALRSNADTRMTADEMKHVLETADFVKFAKVRPLPDDNARAFSRAMSFVETTKPKPAPEPEQEQNAKTN